MKLVLSAAILSGLIGCSTMRGPSPGDIPASIATATSRGDHQKLADYFAKKAADYQSEAAQHDVMARSYTSRPKGEYSSMILHCRNLRDQFIAAAKTARIMAEEHRNMAVKAE